MQRFSKSLWTRRPKPRFRSPHWAWLLALLCAFFPFLMRLGLDVNTVNRQAMHTLYQDWAWSPEVAGRLRGRESLIFERTQARNLFNDYFLARLQADFKVVEVGEGLRVRAFFSKGKELHGRIEWSEAEGGAWKVWTGRARLSNNGLLLGLWVGALLFVLGQPLGLVLGASLTLLLAWQVRWDFLRIPSHVLEALLSWWDQALIRWKTQDFSRLDFSFVALGVGLAWIPIGLVVRSRLWAKFGSSPRRTHLSVLGAFALEPLALWAGSTLSHWPDQASWWKVYLGSLVFRFLSWAFVFSQLVRPSDEVALESDEDLFGKEGLWKRAAFLPTVFVVAGGWEWLRAVTTVDSGTSLLRLKGFLTAFLLAALLGSRGAGILLGVFMLSLVAPPTEGHWHAAATYAFFMDGLVLGWWLSPLKGQWPVAPYPRQARVFVLCAALAWVLGVFLYTAGVPLPVCWLSLLLAIWAYGQVSSSGRALGLR